MRKTIIWSSVVVLLLAIAAIIFMVFLNPQKPLNTSNESLYIYEDDNPRIEGARLLWDANVTGSSSSSSSVAEFICPDTATQAFAFLSEPGKEREVIGGWKAYSQTFLKPDHKVLQPNLKISGLLEGEPGPNTVLRTGGDFSLGLACTHGGNTIVDSVSYRYVSIASGVGEWALTE